MDYKYEIATLYSNFKNDIDDIYGSELSPYERGGKISALRHRYVRQLFCLYLNKAIKKEGIDITFSITQKLAQRAIGRKLCANYVLKNYTTKNRKADNKSEHTDKIEYIYKKYFKTYKEEEFNLKDYMKKVIKTSKNN